ncbi:protein kinase [Herbidospora sp. NEAU-GS84]|uniref:non-specific serine/threonine protein kinase n=1 Tax=Herbidospora solisilvae TaxID=2696284 RepID=A0A7C9JGJ1_9ACTN|nr:serine/threonine-protein kinase [Herbidospora solisilvae]NAS26724.1 protein kinase [Herbidospora solisilvae]
MQSRLLAERYELISPLGRGTMGTVWRAVDRTLGREVAVKEIRQDPGLTQEQRTELRERMIREGRAAARVHHPSVATIFDAIEVGGVPWIIMELVEGRSLEQVVDEDGPLPPRLVAEIGADLLGALRAAHASDILHRDVKPSNVLITHSGRVVLTDFGIAKSRGDTALTQTGMVIGSPGYTAPERARGEYTGPESDLWSLGATLYFAVEARPAYERRSIAETLAALMTEVCDPPRNAGQLRPVLEAMLEKDHTKRITAERASVLLRAVADTPTVTQFPASGPQRPTGGAFAPDAVSPYGDSGRDPSVDRPFGTPRPVLGSTAPQQDPNRTTTPTPSPAAGAESAGHGGAGAAPGAGGGLVGTSRAGGPSEPGAGGAGRPEISGPRSAGAPGAGAGGVSAPYASGPGSSGRAPGTGGDARPEISGHEAEGVWSAPGAGGAGTSGPSLSPSGHGSSAQDSGAASLDAAISGHGAPRSDDYRSGAFGSGGAGASPSGRGRSAPDSGAASPDAEISGHGAPGSGGSGAGGSGAGGPDSGGPGWGSGAYSGSPDAEISGSGRGPGRPGATGVPGDFAADVHPTWAGPDISASGFVRSRPSDAPGAPHGPGAAGGQGLAGRSDSAGASGMGAPGSGGPAGNSVDTGPGAGAFEDPDATRFRRPTLSDDQTVVVVKSDAADPAGLADDVTVVQGQLPGRRVYPPDPGARRLDIDTDATPPSALPLPPHPMQGPHPQQPPQTWAPPPAGGYPPPQTPPGFPPGQGHGHHPVELDPNATQAVPRGLGTDIFSMQRTAPPPAAKPKGKGRLVLLLVLAFVAFVALAVVAVSAFGANSAGPTKTAGRIIPASPTAATYPPDPPAPAPAKGTKRQQGEGYTIDVPAGFGRTAKGTQVVFSAKGKATIRVAEVQITTDLLKSIEAAEAKQPYEGYELIRIAPLETSPYKGADTAEWEYAYEGRNGLVHVVSRWVDVPDGGAFAIYYAVPEAQWAKSEKQRDAVFASFRFQRHPN